MKKGSSDGIWLELTDHLRKHLELEILDYIEPFVQASGAYKDGSTAFLTTSKALWEIGAYIANKEAVYYSGKIKNDYSYCNFSILVDLKNKEVFKSVVFNSFITNIKKDTDGINYDINVKAWIKNNKDYKVIFCPVSITYKNGAGHALMMLIYPHIKVVTLFDPGDILLYQKQDSFIKNCEIVSLAKNFLGLENYKVAIFEDQIRNKNGAEFTDEMQEEMEDEVGKTLHQALLNSDGYCATFCRIAAYLCMVTGIYQPRLLMGILQKLMRKNPPLLVSTLAGFIIKSLSFVEKEFGSDFLKAIYKVSKQKTLEIKGEENNFSWQLSPEAVKELKIDEHK
jgi:hypothetical protein